MYIMLNEVYVILSLWDYDQIVIKFILDSITPIRYYLDHTLSGHFKVTLPADNARSKLFMPRSLLGKFINAFNLYQTPYVLQLFA